MCGRNVPISNEYQVRIIFIGKSRNSESPMMGKPNLEYGIIIFFLFFISKTFDIDHEYDLLCESIILPEFFFELQSKLVFKRMRERKRKKIIGWKPLFFNRIELISNHHQ